MSTYDPVARARRNAEIVRELTTALGARDAAAVEALLTEDVVYHFPGRNPLSGTHRGKTEVMAFFRRFPTLLDGPPTTDTHDVLSSEAHGADLTALTASRGGRSHAWRAVRIYHLVEDRISEVFVTIDDQTAFDDFLNG
jgi:ketosteroid isomerase-like protein